MSTETQSATAPELTIINRVAAIPLVASSLNTIHSTLVGNSLTRTPYNAAQGITQTALSYSEPVQKALAPILVRADSLANAGLDAVESRYPYPFKTPTEDIVKDIKGHSDHAYGVANKTIDERVRAPALSVAQGIDQRFAPIVDYIEGAVGKRQSPNPNGNGSANGAPEGQFQYQRAYALSKDLTDTLYNYSADQIQQIREQNALVQRAATTAQSISDLATSSFDAAQTRVHALSNTMLSELQKVQSSTAALPAAVQASLQDVSTSLSSTINELSTILTSQEPIPEKLTKVRITVQEHVHPLLEAATSRVQSILSALAGSGGPDTRVQQSVTTTNGTTHVPNGNGHAVTTS